MHHFTSYKNGFNLAFYIRLVSASVFHIVTQHAVIRDLLERSIARNYKGQIDS